MIADLTQAHELEDTSTELSPSLETLQDHAASIDEEEETEITTSDLSIAGQLPTTDLEASNQQSNTPFPMKRYSAAHSDVQSPASRRHEGHETASTPQSPSGALFVPQNSVLAVESAEEV